MSISIRKRKLKNGQTSIFLDICSHGKRWSENLNLRLVKDKSIDKRTMELVKQIKALRELELTSNMYGIIPEYKLNADFITYFSKIVVEKKNDACWEATLNKLKKFHTGTIQFRNIDMDWLESFKDFLVKQIRRKYILQKLKLH